MKTQARFKNQKEILNGQKLAETRFVIIGAGAIGSFLTMTLAKMGAERITVYDDDKIEDHNFANQMYPEIAMDAPKVEALSDVVNEYAGVGIVQRKERFTKDTINDSDFVISAVDSMDVRKEIWENAKASESVQYFLDGRMGALTLRCYLIKMSDKNQRAFYEATLYSSKDAVQERCAFKSIIFTVLSVCGVMLNMVKKAINGEPHANEIIYDHVTDIYVPSRAPAQLPEAAEAQLQEA